MSHFKFNRRGMLKGLGATLGALAMPVSIGRVWANGTAGMATACPSFHLFHFDGGLLGYDFNPDENRWTNFTNVQTKDIGNKVVLSKRLADAIDPRLWKHVAKVIVQPIETHAHAGGIRSAFGGTNANWTKDQMPNRNLITELAAAIQQGGAVSYAHHFRNNGLDQAWTRLPWGAFNNVAPQDIDRVGALAQFINGPLYLGPGAMTTPPVGGPPPSGGGNPGSGGGSMGGGGNGGSMEPTVDYAQLKGRTLRTALSLGRRRILGNEEALAQYSSGLDSLSKFLTPSGQMIAQPNMQGTTMTVDELINSYGLSSSDEIHLDSGGSNLARAMCAANVAMFARCPVFVANTSNQFDTHERHEVTGVADKMVPFLEGLKKYTQNLADMYDANPNIKHVAAFTGDCDFNIGHGNKGAGHGALTASLIISSEIKRATVVGRQYTATGSGETDLAQGSIISDPNARVGNDRPDVIRWHHVFAWAANRFGYTQHTLGPSHAALNNLSI